MKPSPRLHVFLALLSLGSCASPSDRSSLLHTVAWVQSAAEREVVCAEIFRSATTAMQQRTPLDEKGAKNFAVIVDVDETMLDNSPYQASLVRDQERYSEESWARWCEQAIATAIPGAVEFANACHARGVKVFYVTNRDCALEAATRRNLLACGFPLDDTAADDVVLTLGEPCDAQGNCVRERSKQKRRDLVAQGHEVVLLVGDDLNDFVDAQPTVPQRREQVRRYAGEWGSRWFALPNPMYGSWESAITRGAADPSGAKAEVLAPTR